LTEQARDVVDTYTRAQHILNTLGYDALHSSEYDEEAGADFSWGSTQVEWMREQIDRSGKLFYLPDFYLPELKKWVEIKPYLGEGSWGEPENAVTHLISGLLVHGMPGERTEYEGMPFYDVGYWFGYCPVCKTFGYGYCAWAERICGESKYIECGHHRKDDMDNTAPFKAAIIAARSARFEHGESG
jgi:hypothetical protein